MKTDNETHNINSKTRDLTFEWVRNSPERLSEISNTLDSKIINVFSISCLIIGVITALSKSLRWNLTIIPFLAACLSFILILIFSLLGIRPQWLFNVDSPQIIREDYWELEPDEAKNKYWEWVEKDYDENLKVVKLKGIVLKVIVPLLAMETTFLMIWLFLRFIRIP
jgi:hypothetical protein